MWYQCNTVVKISIHALLAESDQCRLLDTRIYTKFLSTLSLRRATGRHATAAGYHSHFYPRSPCGERPLSFNGLLAGYPISIHALLAESDAYGRINDISRLIFLSTLSLRRATSWHSQHQHEQKNFYPRSPCGERPGQTHYPVRSAGISIHALLAESDAQGHTRNAKKRLFLSTLSLRRAT